MNTSPAPDEPDEPDASSSPRRAGKSWRERLADGLAWLNPAARIEPADPGKELRFTRSAQSSHFITAAILCFCASFALLTLGLWPWFADGSPFMAIWWPGLVPLPLLGVFLWLAIYCSCHAYIILSPVGLEIFPLWFPSENYRLVPWTHLGAVRAENGRLIVDFPPVGQSGGIVLDLGPLRLQQRELLLHAIMRRLDEQAPGRGE